MGGVCGGVGKDVGLEQKVEFAEVIGCESGVGDKVFAEDDQGSERPGTDLFTDGNVPAEDDIDLLDDDESSAPVSPNLPTSKNPTAAPKSPSSIQLKLQFKMDSLPPVINNSRRFLELSAPK